MINSEEFNKKRAEFLIKQQELDETEAELLAEIKTQKELLSEKVDYISSLEEELTENQLASFGSFDYLPQVLRGPTAGD